MSKKDLYFYKGYWNSTNKINNSLVGINMGYQLNI